MGSDIATIAWIAIGFVLVVAEIFMPGMIIIFFGFGAMIVGLLIWLDLISTVISSIIVWIFLSFMLVLVFRRLALKFFPSERSYQLVEDDVNAIGAVVEVTRTVMENSSEGRIKYNGTWWPAISNRGTIKTGSSARILYRDNISWIVEPCDDTDR